MSLIDLEQQLANYFAPDSRDSQINLNEDEIKALDDLIARDYRTALVLIAREALREYADVREAQNEASMRECAAVAQACSDYVRDSAF